MNDSRIAQLKAAHESAVMVGWDFSRLDGRLVTQDEPWDFDADCVVALSSASTAIDLGTGGGERLIGLTERLAEGATPSILATEGWEPNIDVARENLAPLGIDVQAYDAEASDRLPAMDGSVDLVMSRHESFDPREIARVLKPGGRFLTQQVDGFDVPEIHEWFDAEFLYPHVTHDVDKKRLEDAGLDVEVAEEWSGCMTFSDVEALVIYLGFVPWDAPNFTVDGCAKQLLELDSQGELRVTIKRYRLYATKR